MLKIDWVLAILVVSAICGSPAHAAGPTAGTRDTKPATPGFVPLRTPFACVGRQTFLPTLDWRVVVVDSTVGASRDLPSYACKEWAQEGPEHIYEIVVSETLELVAALSGLDEDLDLFLMSDCDTDSCLIGDNTELAAVLEPGTYWLAVDTFGTGSPPGGPYTLTLSAFWPGVPAGACDTADAAFQPCDGATELSATLFQQPDLLRTYACEGAGTLMRGGERWYALATPPTRLVQLTATPPAGGGLDLALGLFTGCGPDAVCLAFADETRAGDPEVLSWPQEAAAQDTVWLAVDCYAAPADSAAGVFTLGVDCGTVPSESTSFGSFRARYR
jgi:hypothetical protein